MSEPANVEIDPVNLAGLRLNKAFLTMSGIAGIYGLICVSPIFLPDENRFNFQPMLAIMAPIIGCLVAATSIASLWSAFGTRRFLHRFVLGMLLGGLPIVGFVIWAVVISIRQRAPTADPIYILFVFFAASLGGQVIYFLFRWLGNLRFSIHGEADTINVRLSDFFVLIAMLAVSLSWPQIAAKHIGMTVPGTEEQYFRKDTASGTYLAIPSGLENAQPNENTYLMDLTIDPSKQYQSPRFIPLADKVAIKKFRTRNTQKIIDETNRIGTISGIFGAIISLYLLPLILATIGNWKLRTCLVVHGVNLFGFAVLIFLVSNGYLGLNIAADWKWPVAIYLGAYIATLFPLLILRFHGFRLGRQRSR